MYKRCMDGRGRKKRLKKREYGMIMREDESEIGSVNDN